MHACSACGEENPARARFCLACGQAFEVVPDRGQRRAVSIVFADLVGSTALGEALDAEILRNVTGRYFDAMRAAVERHEGRVEKFIGDAVVAVFGVPRVREDDALRAVRAADDMRRSLVDLNRELVSLGVALQVRIGVNTGEVFIGADRAGGSLATGDAVNVAARLQQAAGAGEILIGDATHRLTRHLITLESVPPLTLKGKADPHPAWRLVGIERDATVDEVLLSSFVGRGPHLRLLADALDRVRQQRSCHLVTIFGSAGLGKSRLADEFVASVTGVTVLRGRCPSYGQGAAYVPLREALLSAIGVKDRDSDERVRAAFLEQVGAVPNAGAIVDRLMSVAGGGLLDQLPEHLPWAVRAFLERLAADRPVLVVIDDLHWAQPGLLEIVEHIAESSRESPIMLLFLARPELFDSVEGWGGGKLNSISELLTALSSDGTRQLLDRFPIPPAVVEQVVTTADGNPLFAEQLVAMLVDQGHLVDHEGVLAWSGSSDAVELAMPPSISALLAARIDRLSDAERGVLESAAVIGTVFYVEAVAHLSGISPDEVAHVLGRLVRKELLRSAEATLPGVTAFRFLHVLVRDAAYEGIAKGKRAEWHERLAEWLLELDVGGVENGLVGHHLVAAWRYRRQLGPDDERSRNLASRAAEQLAAASRLLEMSDLAAAASLMEQAVHILPTDSEQRVDLALSLGSQLFQSGELARARALLVPMTSLPSQADSGRARLLISRIDYVTQGDSGMRLAEVVAELIPVLTRAGDHHALSEVYLVQSEYNLTRGDYPAATTSLELAVEHAQLAGDLVGAARARAYLPIVHCFGPTPAEEAIRILDQLAVNAGNDTRVLGEVEQMTCILHAMCGRLDLAKSIAAQARAHLQESGQVLFLANFGQSSGVILTLAKEFDAADREYAESCFALESLGESSYLSTVAGMRAQLLARRGLFDEARRVREYAGAHLTEDDVLTQLLLREVDALLAAVDSPDEARAIIAKAHDESKVFISPDNVGEFHMSAALVGQRIGDSALTERHLLRAQELFRQKGNVVREQAATEALRP